MSYNIKKYYSKHLHLKNLTGYIQKISPSYFGVKTLYQKNLNLYFEFFIIFLFYYKQKERKRINIHFLPFVIFNIEKLDLKFLQKIILKENSNQIKK